MNRLLGYFFAMAFCWHSPIHIAAQDDLSEIGGDLGRNDAGEITFVDLTRTGADDRVFDSISKLTQLESLNLTGTKITDAGLQKLPVLQNLKYVELGGTNVTDIALASLAKQTSLEHIGLDGTHVTDDGIAAIKHLPNLDRLILGAKPTEAFALVMPPQRAADRAPR